MPVTFDYVIKNAQVFINGVGKAGTSDEFKLPKMEKIKETKQSGGLVGQRDVFMGWKPFVLDVTLNSFDPDVTALAGITDGNEIPLSARGYMVGDRGKQHTAVWTGSAEISEVDYDKWQAGKWTVMKLKASCSAVSYTVDGKPVFDIDIPNAINAWGGTDLASYMRSAIGLAV